jgi:hypothetical protein
MNLSLARRNEALDAIANDFDTGYLRVYNGTKPATADTALSGNTLLAELRFPADAFPSASGGVLTAAAITADTTADATGTPTFVRCLQSDGTTVICDLTAAVGSGEVNFASLITAANRVEITSLTITWPA